MFLENGMPQPYVNQGYCRKYEKYTQGNIRTYNQKISQVQSRNQEKSPHSSVEEYKEYKPTIFSPRNPWYSIRQSRERRISNKDIQGIQAIN